MKYGICRVIEGVDVEYDIKKWGHSPWKNTNTL